MKLNTRSTIDEEVERYLRTGESDPHREAWSGGFLEREKRAHQDLRGALVCEVRRLAEGRSHRLLPEADTVTLTRRKVDRMARRLFVLTCQYEVPARFRLEDWATRWERKYARIAADLVRFVEERDASTVYRDEFL
jgi:hypothetical protein